MAAPAQPLNASGTAGPRRRTTRARLIWAPVVLLAVVLLIVLIEQPTVVIDPPWLLAPLNLAFLTAVPLLAAAVAVGAYRATGVGAVLAIGTAMLATALGAGLVPAVVSVAADRNALVTLHNTAILVAAICHAAAALGGVVGVSLGRGRGLHVALAYGTVAALLAVAVLLYGAGLLPPFWTAEGPTELRQAVLGTAIVLLGISAFAWWEVSARDRGIRFLAWYVPGLLLMAIGLVAVLAQVQVGGLTSWLGRTCQYLGAVYMLVAVLPESRRGGVSEDLGIGLLQAALPFRPLVESSSDAIVAVGRTRRVVVVNDAARRLFGRTLAEAFDADPADVLLGSSAMPAARAALRETLAAATSGSGPRQLVLEHRDGTPFPAELSVFASADDDRLLVYAIRDVTDRVRAREELETRVRDRTAELERANRELEEANRAKDEFLGLVSHELRTPITTILAAGHLLQRRLGADDPHGLASDIVAEASQLAGIVDNLLALARLDTGRTADMEPIALDRLVGASVVAARHSEPDRDIVPDLEPGVIVEGTDSQLFMVVGNYLANACKYSPRGSPVEVSLRAEAGLARVTVLDRGPGIEADEGARLFEPFYRSPSSAAVPGIGIGLTVCRRIIEALGGTVGARARDDGPGSAFWFTLPLAPAPDDDGPAGPEDERGGTRAEAGVGAEPGPGRGGATESYQARTSQRTV